VVDFVSRENIDQVVLIEEDLRVTHMKESHREAREANFTAHTLSTAAAGDV
jgi:hypothetical protein